MLSSANFYKNIFKMDRIASSQGEADPFLIKVNGEYFLFFTVGEGIVAYKTFDFEKFSPVNGDGYVAKGIKELKNAFAPEVCYYNGYFYLICSPNGNGHYIFKSEKIEGPFIKISENIHEMIDGSFFVDSDFKKYLSRSGETGIVINEFDSFEQIANKKPFVNSYTSKECILGRWNEGPHIFKRYGVYYLTFTGTHFLSDAYRVSYASGKSICKWNDLKYRDTLLLSTEKDFYGLGHSMNILAPNLDSYLICYHNMNDDGIRTMNLSRLVFNKKGEMMVNYLSKDTNFKLERPIFEKYIDEKSFISDNTTGESFTIEYNFLGKNTKLLFSYISESEYSYISFEDGKLLVNQFKNNIISCLHEINTKDIDYLKYHTLRMQYKNKKMALYLDLIELDYEINIKLLDGKFGFKDNELGNAYLALSKYSFGDSDLVEPFVNTRFADLCIKENGICKYNFYIKENGIYKIIVTFKKDINLEGTVDFSRIKSKNIVKHNYNIYEIFDGYLEEGYHELKLNNNNCDLIKILKLNESGNIFIKSFDENINLYNFDLYHNYLIKNNGIYFENDRNIYITKDKYSNYEVETKCEVIGNGRESGDFIGLAVNINNYAKVNSFENGFSLNGYLFVANMDYLMIYQADFYRSKLLFKQKNNDRKFTLKITQDNNFITFYNNGIEIFSTYNANKYLSGKIGILNNHLSGVFYDLKISIGDKNYEDI